MADAIDFAGSNFVFVAPEGSTDVVDLPTFRQPDGHSNVSCWRLSPEELEEVNRTGCVFLTVLCGHHFPPVFVGSESMVRSVVVNYGQAWRGAQS